MRDSGPMLAVVIAGAMFLSGCAGSGSGSGSSGRSTASRAGAPQEKGFPASPEKAAEPSRGDRRVMLHQARNNVLMILVNAGHSGLKTKQGQLAIALGNPQQSYKVIDETKMEELLQNLRTRGLNRVGTPFERGDEKYFQTSGEGPDRYRGLVYVEDNGVRTKALGMRPLGETDVDGQQKMQLFADLKMIFLMWWDLQTRSELPSGEGSVGGR